MNEARLIIDEPASGVWNMAVDQALLQSAGDRGQVTLRLYQWSRPTLSLGYFQKYDDRKLHPASESCDVIRRRTGGGAIMHDHELTYSLAVPQKHRWSSRNADLYDLVHQVVIEQLKECGLQSALYSQSGSAGDDLADPDSAEMPKIDKHAFLCFQRRSDGDVVSGGWKIVGSAQRRLKNSLLQHGSILLGRSKFAPEIPGIEQLTQNRMNLGQFGEIVSKAVATSLHVSLAHGKLSGDEIKMAKEIECEFSDPGWTESR